MHPTRLTAVVLFAAWSSGCGSSSNPVDAAVGDSGTVTDSGTVIDGSGGSDSATPDAAAGGFANLPGPRLFRFAHMHAGGTGLPAFPDAVDVCLTKTGGAPVRLYGGSAGIGRFQVGAWRVFELGTYVMKVILPTETCADAGVYSDNVEQLNDSADRRVTYILITSGAGMAATARINRTGPTDVASNDILSYTSGLLGGAPTMAFVDGAGTTAIGNNMNVVLAPGRVGNLVMAFTPPPPANVTRAIRTATGQVSIISHGNRADNAVGFVVCDDLAASVGPLSRCDTTVRAP